MKTRSKTDLVLDLLFYGAVCLIGFLAVATITGCGAAYKVTPSQQSLTAETKETDRTFRAVVAPPGSAVELNPIKTTPRK